MKHLVSIIITSKNESGVIEKLLKSLKKQNLKKSEIILVDNNSTDDTVKIAKKYTKNIYNFGPERSAQRNHGAKKAKGEYLLFLDADMQLSKNVVKDCVELVTSSKRIGSVIIPEESIAHTFWEKVKGFERSFYNLKGDPITDAARFFPKRIFIKAGGYDETITGPEDWDLPETINKLGYESIRIKSKIYHKERVSNPITLARKKYYYGLRAYKYLEKHNISIVGSKTIYFLRPVFYKNLDKFVKHPLLSLGMIVMLSAELVGGGLGYVTGKIRKI